MEEVCPKRRGRPHHAIKLDTKLHPDESWWCTACGKKDLPPSTRKDWE